MLITPSRPFDPHAGGTSVQVDAGRQRQLMLWLIHVVCARVFDDSRALVADHDARSFGFEAHVVRARGIVH